MMHSNMNVKLDLNTFEYT